MADSTGHKAIGDRFASLEFFANYVHHSSPLAHLWSISCEMQFYLVSPLLFWLGTRAGLTLVWLGKRTYSIYLVQQFFTIAAPYDPVWWPIGGLISVAVGGVFYALIESRFVKTASR